MSSIKQTSISQRLAKINSIIAQDKSLPVSDEHIKNLLLKKFPELKRLSFIHLNNIETGMYIKCVTLDMERIIASGFVTKLYYSYNVFNERHLDTILVKSLKKKYVLRINPTKYYIFCHEKGTTKSHYDIVADKSDDDHMNEYLQDQIDDYLKK